MPPKRKRSGKQAVPDKKGRNKMKSPLDFVGGDQSTDSGQRKLEEFFVRPMDEPEAQGESTRKKTMPDREGILSPTSSPMQRRDRGRAPVSSSRQFTAKVQETGPAEIDLVLLDTSGEMLSGKESEPNKPKGRLRQLETAAAIATSSKKGRADPSALPGSSGVVMNRQESRVKKTVGTTSTSNSSSDDRRMTAHPISDSKSDTLSDSQPITPIKKTGSWWRSPLSSPRRQLARTSSPSLWSARDTEAYRNRYPDKKDNKSLNDNWKFYNNEIPSKPRGTHIDAMHKHWFGDYSLLEEHHGYIQWLFPIREMGMNWQSQELQSHEAERICKDPKCSERVIKSYELMLNFWGMHLEDKRTGKIVRGDNWKERFRNLNRSSHNYLRITRMLKSLGELGHERLKLPFLEFVLREAIVERTLANAERSCLNYWIHTLRVDRERTRTQAFADKLLAGNKH